MKSNILILIILLLLVILLTVKLDFKVEKKPITKKLIMDKDTNSNFLNDLIKFTKDKEGGLTNNLADSASKFPSPTKEKWHTNKGITWKTFVDSSKTLKYNPSVDNFLKMPDDIWLSIFNNKYMDKAKNLTPNPVFNAYLGLWFWGGWAKSLMPTERIVKVIASNKTDKQKLKDLVNLRKEYFDNVIKRNPKNKIFERGWKKRADDFYNTFSKYLN